MTPVTDKIIKQLQKANLTTEDRSALVSALLNKLVALPLDNTLVVTQEGITINNRKLDQEQVIKFREACISLKENFAYQIINGQIRFLAVNMGINKSLSMDTLLFAKAGLWILQEQEKILDQII